MTADLAIDRDTHQLRFTREWFCDRNLRTFRQFVYPQWAGKPLTYLEVGVYEGMSMVWMAQHVLTDPDARAVGIDPWLMSRKLDPDEMEEVRQRAVYNTSFYHRCRLVRGCSAEVLRRMRGRRGYAGICQGCVDLCLIDGDHNAPYVLDDARQCLFLLEPGGVMMFDDVVTCRPNRAHHVKEAIATFVEEAGDQIELLWTHGFIQAFRKCK